MYECVLKHNLSITGFRLNLNQHFFDDIFLDYGHPNGHPRKIFVWINEKLLHYNLSRGECSFYHSAAIIKNVCEMILILLFKLGFLEQ
jgi:hypothetical protein